MGRLPKIRESYANDAGHLARLIEAIELDPQAKAKWKKLICQTLANAQRLLLEETARRM